MKLVLSDIEATLLMDLVYAGNWLINGCRKPSDVILPYKDMVNKILSPKTKKKDDEEVSIDEVLYNRLEKFIEYYSDNTLLENLAIKLAEAEFGTEATLERTLAEEKYRAELMANGLKNINLKD